jgi:hypothetical protein
MSQNNTLLLVSLEPTGSQVVPFTLCLISMCMAPITITQDVDSVKIGLEWSEQMPLGSCGTRSSCGHLDLSFLFLLEVCLTFRTETRLNLLTSTRRQWLSRLCYIALSPMAVMIYVNRNRHRCNSFTEAQSTALSKKRLLWPPLTNNFTKDLMEG